MRRCIVALLTLFSSDLLLARELTSQDLTSPIPIHGREPTILILPEPAKVFLTGDHLTVLPLADGQDNNYWQLKPKCRLNCHKLSTKLEFVMQSGKHLSFQFNFNPQVKDLLIKVLPDLPLAHHEQLRHRDLARARSALLSLLSGWHQWSLASDEVPKEIRGFAKDWKVFGSENLLIYEGRDLDVSKSEVTSLSNRNLLLTAQDRDRIIIIARRAT
jgi:hypothetical protein